MTSNRDLDRAYTAAAADVFERSYQESLPPEIRERQQLQAEFDFILNHARRTLLCWSENQPRKLDGRPPRRV